MATESSVNAALPPSQFTPEARAHRASIASRMNRCAHSVNLVMRRCPDCEAQGLYAGAVVAAVNVNGSGNG